RIKFPKIQRISCYAMPKNLLEKSSEDLKKLYDAGLTMFYIGIESGSDKILKKVTKGATGQTIIKACKKAMDAGHIISCMIILGLGGKTHSKEHIDETAKVVSEISPNYLGALTLHIEDGIREEFMTKFKEPFVPIDDSDALAELENLVSKIETTSQIVFRANHGSNAYPIGGTFPEDKKDILERITYLKDHPELCRPQGFRGF
ncbi:MAG: radical SAM protein, partial [Nitrosopumilaceae archaeon]